MDMDLSVIMLVVLLKWQIWENKLEKELTDLMLQEILLLLLEKDLPLDLLPWYLYLFMVVSYTIQVSRKINHQFPWKRLTFLPVSLLVLCYLIYSQPLLSDQSEKLHLVWSNKLEDKLEKTPESSKELSNQITELALEFLQELLLSKWSLQELW